MPEVSSTQELVSQIHAAPGQIVLAVTGGGSRAVADLLEVPGGSRTLLEAVVPYSAAALAEFLHGEPEQACSPRTARAMAMAAFQRARRLRGSVDKSLPVVGIGCTASLTSDRPKKGAHRIHVAWQTAETTATQSLELIKNRRDRAQEEQVAATMVLNAVAEAMHVDSCLPLQLEQVEQIDAKRTVARPEWRALLLGRFEKWRYPNALEQPMGIGIFPGAFNPLHKGHRAMFQLAMKRLKSVVEFELSIENVDKLPLDYIDIEKRVAQIKNLPMWLTRAPTFVDKARLFPGSVFIVGADTITRIGDAKYYGNDPAAAEAAIESIAQAGCRFLVYSRLVDEKVQTLKNITLPDSLRKLCDEVPMADFLENISSTDLRKERDDEIAD